MSAAGHDDLRQPDGTPIATLFVESIQAVVDRFRSNGLTIAEAVGCLELVKLDIYTEVAAGGDRDMDD